jgi:hypothetical protein
VSQLKKSLEQGGSTRTGGATDLDRYLDRYLVREPDLALDLDVVEGGLPQVVVVVEVEVVVVEVVVVVVEVEVVEVVDGIADRRTTRVRVMDNNISSSSSSQEGPTQTVPRFPASATRPARTSLPKIA